MKAHFLVIGSTKLFSWIQFGSGYTTLIICNQKYSNLIRFERKSNLVFVRYLIYFSERSCICSKVWHGPKIGHTESMFLTYFVMQEEKINYFLCKFFGLGWIRILNSKILELDPNCIHISKYWKFCICLFGSRKSPHSRAVVNRALPTEL